MMVLNGEEELKSVIYIDWIHLEQVSEFKYFRCVLDKLSTDGVECIRKVVNGRRVENAIKFLVNVRDLKFEYVSLA